MQSGLLNSNDEEPVRMRVPELGLWISVLLLSLRDIRTQHESADEAILWIRDPENIFLRWIAEELNFPPDKFRNKLMGIIKKGKRK